MEKASELFWDAFFEGGSIASDCRCGRFHFSRLGSWEDDELAEYLAKEKQEPDKYIGTNDDYVAIWNGICYNCPCGLSKKYEDFIVYNEDNIIKYYRMKAKRAWKKATAAQSNLESLRLENIIKDL